MTSRMPDAGTAHKLRGKIALVTGSSRRLGRAIAISLAEHGIHIVAHDRKALGEETEKVCNEVAECGAKSWKVLADLESPDEYQSMIKRALSEAGSLDVLINNASIFLPGNVMETGFGDVIRHCHINAWAPFVLSREFARQAHSGKIINLLDTRITGHYDRGHVAYLLSKQMLAGLTRICALEFSPGFTVNAIAPGLILPPPGQDERYLDRLAGTVPLRRHGEAQDVSDAALFLLHSDFITGQTIYVDGGRHLLGDVGGPHSDT